jgi:benzodiazapine receptor
MKSVNTSEKFNLNVLIIFIPIVLGFSTSFFCPPGETARTFEPPRALFSIVWPVLYLLLGYAWYLSNVNGAENNLLMNSMFILLNVLLCAWLITYSCVKNKYMSFYILLSSILVSFLLYTFLDIKWAKLCLCPLIVWLCFATLLSFN